MIDVAALDQIGEDELRHSAAADVAVANEQDFMHRFISPDKSCVSSQNLDITGFFDI